MGKDYDLMQAVKDEDLPTIKKLLSRNRSLKASSRSAKKTSINLQDSDGMTPLHQAALIGNEEVIKQLLDVGALVDLKDSKGMRPLHYAAWQGKDRPVELLLQHRASPNEPALDGNTPVHLACEHGHVRVVDMLLQHKGDPTCRGKEYKTPLDLACEFGRTKVVELLLGTQLCGKVLADSPDDITDNQRTTSIHLAARNGHVDIVRLLLQANVNINRQTLQGTCLHEAAMYGKIEVVKLLLMYGADVNQLNSYEQTALEVVNRFTTSRAAKDLKQLLTDASVLGASRAVKEYNMHHESGKIVDNHMYPAGKNFASGQNGMMGYSAGHSPRAYPNGHIHSNRNDRIPSHVPLHAEVMGHPTGCISVGRDPHPQQSSPSLRNRSSSSDCSRAYNSPSQRGAPATRIPAVSVVQQHSPGLSAHSYALSVSRPDGDVFVPGKGSPSGSNRSSTSSSSSGYLGSNHASTSSYAMQNRLSGHSCESGVSSSRQSYHSNSSHGSLDHLDDVPSTPAINVSELQRQGLNDEAILRCWLESLHLDECWSLFIAAGYDMPTISRMTPEDMTAIGITKPTIRKRLKMEISRLDIHDGIPDFRPKDLAEWLNLLHLEEYYDTLKRQGYDDIDLLTEITWEDLEEIGIRKLGHQKKIILAVDRLKRVNSCLQRLGVATRGSTGEVFVPYDGRSAPQFATECTNYCSNPAAVNAKYDLTLTRRNKMSDNANNIGYNGRLTEDIGGRRNSAETCDIVTINVSRPSGSARGRLMTQTPALQSFSSPISKLYDKRDCDGDVTPTNDKGGLSVEELGSASDALERETARVSEAFKQKPVARIIAKPKQTSAETPDTLKPSSSDMCGARDNIYSYNTLPRKAFQKRRYFGTDGQTENDYDIPSDFCIQSETEKPPVTTGNQVVTSSAGADTFGQFGVPSQWNDVKKVPPPLPKRIDSFRKETTCDSSKPPLGQRLTTNASGTAEQNRTHKTHSKSLGAKPDSKSSLSTFSTTATSRQVSQKRDNQSAQEFNFASLDDPLKEAIAQLEIEGSKTRNIKLGDWQDSNLTVDSSDDSDSGLDSSHSGSTECLNSNESSSSTESHTLPFANENVGTIKQRNQSGKPGGGSNGEELLEGETGTMKRNRKALEQKTAAGKTMASSSTVSRSPQTRQNSGNTENMLNDLDDMLQGLTLELDNEILRLQD